MMLSRLPLPADRRPLIAALAVLLCLVCAAIVLAQVEGERGIAPVAASTDIVIEGVEVDVTGESARDAQQEGWREAQRIAWERAGGPAISDSQLQSLVSSIVIEKEQIGPRRYIATLGVIFDRQRAGSLLGRGGQVSRSAPMLLLPVTVSGGTAIIYEQRNAWQRAWAEFQPGGSRINYVRPSGAGGQSLLLTAGQTERRSRYWWRTILDQFNAADVLIPVARLEYTYPGGPITGRFVARFGPDSRYLDGFTMTAASDEELPDMLRNAVRQLDRIYQRALTSGRLRPDATLDLEGGEVDPALQQLIELGRQLENYDRTQAAPPPAATPDAQTPADQPDTPAASIATYTVQFATPDAQSFDAALSGVRGAPGVRGASVSSTALGGTSVMSVQYTGSLGELAAALSARGFTVQQGSNALLISR